MATPEVIFCPAAGSCETTIEAADISAGGTAGGGVGAAGIGTVAATEGVVDSGADEKLLGTGATVTFPTVNPAFCRVLVTLPRGCPMNVGITND